MLGWDLLEKRREVFLHNFLTGNVDIKVKNKKVYHKKKKKKTRQKKKHPVYNSLMTAFFFSQISLVETNLTSQVEEKVQSLIQQRVEKGTVYSGAASVVSLDLR